MTKSSAYALLAGLVLGLGVMSAGWSKTVGVWQVAPRYESAAIRKTLEADGWRLVVVSNQQLADGTGLAELDVLLVPGGWDVYRLVGFPARRHLVRFVAGGKALLDSAADTSHRPLFPKVGTTAGYLTGMMVAAHGKHPPARCRYRLDELARVLAAGAPLARATAAITEIQQAEAASDTCHKEARTVGADPQREADL